MQSHRQARSDFRNQLVLVFATATSCTRAFLRLHEMVRWRFEIHTQPSRTICLTQNGTLDSPATST